MAEGLRVPLLALVRAHLRALGYAGFGAAVFLASLAATFPYAATLSALLKPLSLSLSSSGQGFSPPLGAALSDVRLVSIEPSAPFEVESSNVTLAPAFGALLFGEPGVRVHARLYGGALRATVYRNGAGVGLSFTLSDLGLARMAALRGLGANVLGRLSGDGWAQLESNDPMAASAQIDFHAADLTVRVARGFAPIRLGAVRGSLKLARGAIQVTRLDGRGPDGMLAGRGTVRLGPDAAQSNLDLRLVIEPSPEGRKRLGVLFGLLPHPPGPRQPYVLTGPLLAPSIS
jgi:type II secretion system protein N